MQSKLIKPELNNLFYSKSLKLGTFFAGLIMLCSFLPMVFYEHYLFIQVNTYIQASFCTGLFFLLPASFFKKPGGKLLIELNSSDLLFTLFIIYLVIRYITSPRFNMLPDGAIFFGILGCLYFIVRFSLINSTSGTGRRLLIGGTIISTLQILYTLAQIAGLFPNYFDYKIGGTFGNPGDLANFLCLGAAITLGLLLSENNSKVRIALLGIYLLHIAIIGFSMARTAWIAALFSGVYLLYRFKIKDKITVSFFKYRKTFFGIIILLLLTAPFLGFKLYQLKPQSASGRKLIWKLSTELIREKPVLGHGYESFQTAYSLRQIEYFADHPEDKDSGWVAGEPVFAFNDYIQLALEYGFLGLILFLSLLVMLLFKSSKISSPTDEQLIVRAALTALLVAMLFSYPLQNPSISIYLVVLAAIYAAEQKKGFWSIYAGGGIRITSSVLLLGLAAVLFFTHTLPSIHCGRKWKEAYAQFQANEPGHLEIYKSIEKRLKQNRSFLFNYGSILLKNGDFEGGIKQYTEYGYLFPKTDQYLMLGRAYEQVGAIDKAKEAYQNAANMVPHKFIPKYSLFKLYQHTGNNALAYDMAAEIQGMKIKIYSEPVKNIKTEINAYLLSNRP